MRLEVEYVNAPLGPHDRLVVYDESYATFINDLFNKGGRIRVGGCYSHLVSSTIHKKMAHRYSASCERVVANLECEVFITMGQRI